MIKAIFNIPSIHYSNIPVFQFSIFHFIWRIDHWALH